MPERILPFGEDTAGAAALLPLAQQLATRFDGDGNRTWLIGENSKIRVHRVGGEDFFYLEAGELECVQTSVFFFTQLTQGATYLGSPMKVWRYFPDRPVPVEPEDPPRFEQLPDIDVTLFGNLYGPSASGGVTSAWVGGALHLTEQEIFLTAPPHQAQIIVDLVQDEEGIYSWVYRPQPPSETEFQTMKEWDDPDELTKFAGFRAVYPTSDPPFEASTGFFHFDCARCTFPNALYRNDAANRAIGYDGKYVLNQSSLLRFGCSSCNVFGQWVPTRAIAARQRLIFNDLTEEFEIVQEPWNQIDYRQGTPAFQFDAPSVFSVQRFQHQPYKDGSYAWAYYTGNWDLAVATWDYTLDNPVYTVRAIHNSFAVGPCQGIWAVNKFLADWDHSWKGYAMFKIIANPGSTCCGTFPGKSGPCATVYDVGITIVYGDDWSNMWSSYIAPSSFPYPTGVESSVWVGGGPSCGGPNAFPLTGPDWVIEPLEFWNIPLDDAFLQANPTIKAMFGLFVRLKGSPAFSGAVEASLIRITIDDNYNVSAITPIYATINSVGTPRLAHCGKFSPWMMITSQYSWFLPPKPCAPGFSASPPGSYNHAFAVNMKTLEYRDIQAEGLPTGQGDHKIEGYFGPAVCPNMWGNI